MHYGHTGGLETPDMHRPPPRPEIPFGVPLGPDTGSKEDLPEIKKKFGAVSISINRVRAQFFKLGNPPQNIAIGRNVPVSTARLAIQIAIQYNQGIKYLLAEERLATDYIAIGTSMFDELLQIPIAPEDLERLSDPSLSTPQFHSLYRHLTGEDKRSPSQ